MVKINKFKGTGKGRKKVIKINKFKGIAKGRNQENVKEKVLNGKVEKTKNKTGSLITNPHSVLQVQNVDSSVKSDTDSKLSKKTTRKVKLLRKKMEAQLNSNSDLIKTTYKPTAPIALPKSKKKRLKKKLKLKKSEENEETEEKPLPVTRFSDDPAPKKVEWINRQRVLVLASRRINARGRHLMKDMRRLMPHSRPEQKMERKEHLSVVNEIAELKNCNKCMLFEGHGNRDVYLWLSNVRDGPSVKFLLQNYYTLDELKFTGNCLTGSRPLLSFDSNFDATLHYRLIKEMLVLIFGTPNKHPKSQPFFDHVYTFCIVQNRIWFRNYQILSEDGALVEIGPRFVMNPIKIFSKSFGGETIWDNPKYVTPAKTRQLLRKANSGKYQERLHKKIDLIGKQGQTSYKLRETDEIFSGDPWQKAKELISGDTETTEPQKEKGVGAQKRKRNFKNAKGKAKKMKKKLKSNN